MIVKGRIPREILDEAAQLPEEEFNAKKYVIEAKDEEGGIKLFLFRIVEGEIRLYLLPEPG